MRCDQFMGLSESAVEFLKKNKQPSEICECCKQTLPRKLKICGTFPGMFMNTLPLHRHTLKDGSYADEFHQCAPWSSGACHFLGLRLANGTEFTWTEEEIEDWL